jgi:hypothetical protein
VCQWEGVRRRTKRKREEERREIANSPQVHQKMQAICWRIGDRIEAVTSVKRIERRAITHSRTVADFFTSRITCSRVQLRVRRFIIPAILRRVRRPVFCGCGRACAGGVRACVRACRREAWVRARVQARGGRACAGGVRACVRAGARRARVRACVRAGARRARVRACRGEPGVRAGARRGCERRREAWVRVLRAGRRAGGGVFFGERCCLPKR